MMATNFTTGKYINTDSLLNTQAATHLEVG